MTPGEPVSRVDRLMRAAATGLLVFCLGLTGTGAVLPDDPPEQVRPVPAAAPVRLTVPSIKLTASVHPIEVDGSGVLHPPEDTADVGWWQRSAKPGSDTGQTVITGHTVHTGAGVMNRLGDVEPGDRIRVRTRQGVFDYEATKVFVYSRAQLAKNAHALMGQHRSEPRLVLITCTDFDGREYQSNLIVLGKPVGARRLPGRRGEVAEAARTGIAAR